MTNDFISIENTGYQEVIAAYSDLEENIQKRILKKALSEGGRYFKSKLLEYVRNSGIDVTSVGKMNYAKGLAKSGSSYGDSLIDAVTGKYHRGRGFDNSLFKVSEMGYRKPNSGTFRLRFFENGTKDRIQHRVSKHGKRFDLNVGHLPAKHFMTNTLASASGPTEAIVERVILEEVEKYSDKVK